jgi:putative transposase
MLNLIDEHSRECLMIRSERRWSSAKVIEALADVMMLKGVPEHLRSDNGPEFVARDLRKWLAGTGAKTAYIEPGSPWENGYCESFNSKLRDEFLNGELYSMKEIRALAERWREGSLQKTNSKPRKGKRSLVTMLLYECYRGRLMRLLLRARREPQA